MEKNVNPKYLKLMGEEELDRYANAIGISTAAAKTAAQKVALIEKERSRSVTVEALGVVLELPAKRVRDQRFSDLMNKSDRTDDDLKEAFALLLGESQYAQLVEAATDEDGTVDAIALGFALNSILTSDALKNS
jgi:hypothetical protein